MIKGFKDEDGRNSKMKATAYGIQHPNFKFVLGWKTFGVSETKMTGTAGWELEVIH